MLIGAGKQDYLHPAMSDATRFIAERSQTRGRPLSTSGSLDVVLHAEYHGAPTRTRSQGPFKEIHA